MFPHACAPKITGHCRIIDYDTNEVLADRSNACNFEAFSLALALSLADQPNGNIQTMVFGNGASSVSATGAITYLPPNVTGTTATLHNQTWSKVVNNQSTLDLDTTENFITVSHTANTTFSDVTVTCLLAYGEPAAQQAFDNAAQVNGEFIFDELGLTTSTGMLLSHVIFHPVQKALDRQLQIEYVIRIVMS